MTDTTAPVPLPAQTSDDHHSLSKGDKVAMWLEFITVAAAAVYFVLLPIFWWNGPHDPKHAVTWAIVPIMAIVYMNIAFATLFVASQGMRTIDTRTVVVSYLGSLAMFGLCFVVGFKVYNLLSYQGTMLMLLTLVVIIETIWRQVAQLRFARRSVDMGR